VQLRGLNALGSTWPDPRASFIYGRVVESCWDTVYVVGGGPSLIGFDFRVLRQQQVLAINDAFLHIPWATALFSLDARWIKQRRKEAEQFSGEIYLAVHSNFNCFDDPGKGVYLQSIPQGTGLSSDPSSIHGTNSGFGAVNLAFLKRASRIVLLGFDFNSGGKHWHKGYPWQGRPNNVMYSKWAERLEEAAPQLKLAGIEVLDASPNGQMTKYPKIDLQSLPL